MATVPLKRGLRQGQPTLVVDEHAVTLDVPVLFRAPLAAPRDDLVGVVDLAHHEPSAEPLWDREPITLFVKTGQQETEANLMLLFRRPVPLPPMKPGARQVLGVSRHDVRDGVPLDVLTVAADDPDAAVATLREEGVPVVVDHVEALRPFFTVVDDPERAVVVAAEREGRRSRARRMARLSALGGMFFGLAEASALDDEFTMSQGLARLSALAVTVAVSVVLLAARRKRAASPRWVAEAAVAYVVLLLVHRVAEGDIELLAYSALWAWPAALLYVLVSGLGAA